MAIRPKIMGAKKMTSATASPFNTTLPFTFARVGSGINEDTINQAISIKLNSTQTVVLSQSATLGVVLNLVSSTGSAITLLNAATISAASVSVNNKLLRLSDTRFLFVYRASSNGYPTAIVVTVASNTMSVGTATPLTTAVFTDAGSQRFDVDVFSETTGILIYSYKTASTYYIRCVAFAIDTATILNVGSNTTLGTHTLPSDLPKSVVCISSSQAIVAYSVKNAYTDTDTETFKYMILTLSAGPSLSGGTPTTYSGKSVMHPIKGIVGSDGKALFILGTESKSTSTYSDGVTIVKYEQGTMMAAINTDLTIGNSPSIYGYEPSGTSLSYIFFQDDNKYVYATTGSTVYKYDVANPTESVGKVNWMASPISRAGAYIQIGSSWFFIYGTSVAFGILSTFVENTNASGFNIITGAPGKLKCLTSLFLTASGGVLIASGLNIFVKVGENSYKVFTTAYTANQSYPGYIDTNNLTTNRGITLDWSNHPIIINDGEIMSIEPLNGSSNWAYDAVVFGYEEDI